VSLIKSLEKFIEQNNSFSYNKKLFADFLEHGFPTIKDEEWKYTSLKKIINLDYNINMESDFELDKSVIEKNSLKLKNKIIFCNGSLISHPVLSGISISGFTNFECRNNDANTILNAALGNKGYSIKVESNVVINEPIEILFFNTIQNSFTQYRSIIEIKKSSNVSFVEKIYDLSNSNSLVNNFTKVSCDENSSIEFNKIQNNTPNSKLIDCMNIFQKKNSIAQVNTFIFGGDFVRNNLNFEQNGTNCESNMSGISLINKNQLADNHTFVDHKSAHCRSNEMYKGIYLDNSKGVFNGKIMVRKDAQKIDAFQSNNNLLLSDSSSIDSKPQLEIYADDVKCSHGCTIGQLDNEALFYMRSRGVGLEEAKAVLTYAFTSEVIDQISIAEVQNLVRNLLAEKLNVDLDFDLV
tara:strand:- start:2111 stop:3337 length:1227 start_codon:yes stop_codon:yes gene_type:complete